jgi:hypothetical protein
VDVVAASSVYLGSMNRFLSLLLVSPLADGKTWVVMKEFDFSGAIEDELQTVAVATGFQTDFASIPRVFWVVLPKWGKYGNAAVVHDWLYWAQPHGSDGKARKVADRVLLLGMRALKVPTWQQQVIYRGVRVFGWLAWERNAAERRAGHNRVLSALPTEAGAVSTRDGQLVTLARACGQRMSRMRAA